MSTISNKTLMEKGYAPFNRSGEKVYLQHVGYVLENPVAEFTKEQCRAVSQFAVETDEEINRELIAREKRNHWRKRINL